MIDTRSIVWVPQGFNYAADKHFLLPQIELETDQALKP